jgi:multiple sugar transport system substrate-binding protein
MPGTVRFPPEYASCGAPPLNRRRLLAGLGVAVAGLSLAACGQATSAAPTAAPAAGATTALTTSATAAGTASATGAASSAGGATGSATPAPANSAASTAATAQGGGPAAASANACTAPVEYLSPWDVGTDIGAGLVKLNGDFAQAVKGCSAQLLYVSSDNTTILEKLVVMVAAGTPPPVALVPAQQTPLWIGKGILQPLTALAARDKVTKEQFFPGYWPQMVLGGKFWRLPFQIDVNFPWFWNKATLRQAGLDDSAPPATIDELDQMAQKLTSVQGTSYNQLGMVPWDLYGDTNSLQSWAFAYGGRFQNADYTKVTANDPKIVQALEWMVGWARQLGGYDQVQKFLAGIPKQPQAAIAAGKLAMTGLVSSAAAAIPTINKTAEVAGGLFPGTANAKPGEATWLSGRGIGLVAGAKDVDGAWQFVKWVSATPEGTTALIQRTGSIPGFQASPGLAALAKDPILGPFVRSVQVAKGLPPGAVLAIDIWGNKRSDLITQALQQKIPASQALEQVTTGAQAELDQALAPK